MHWSGQTTLAVKASAVTEVETTLGLPVVSIVKLDTLLTYLAQREEVKQHLEAITRYRNTYRG